EGGIRDKLVTGVQTCALPIFNEGVSYVPGSTAPSSSSRGRAIASPTITSMLAFSSLISVRISPASKRPPGVKMIFPPPKNSENKIGRASCRERVEAEVDHGYC